MLEELKWAWAKIVTLWADRACPGQECSEGNGAAL